MRGNKILRAALLLLAPGLVALPSIVSAGFPPQPANAACCYFAAKDKDINQPGQKAFISWSPDTSTEAFTVQPKFEGNALDFGMVIPTPSRPKLDEMSRDFFANMALYTILMPLPQPIYLGGSPVTRGGFRAVPPSGVMYLAGAGAPRRSSVRVLEAGVVGSLDYKIIVADRSDDLFTWLKENKYSYGGDEATLQFYIKKKWFFTVMKIDSKQMKKSPDGSYLGEITPTRFTFSSKECIYPLKITQLSVKDKTDALFYVQSPRQMDLAGDLSWMHSYRAMYLTYMLGCGVDPAQAKELQTRNQWVQEKRRLNPGFETTKLEWAMQLGADEISVLEDPLKNYGQTGTGNLPPGARVTALPDFLADARKLMENPPQWPNRRSSSGTSPEFVKSELARMEDQYQPSKGMIVENPSQAVGKSYFYTKYSWYPAREAPKDEVGKLSLLKGHLRKGQYLTKFRRIISKQEMTDDLVLAEVSKSDVQTYTRIMPTSPP